MEPSQDVLRGSLASFKVADVLTFLSMAHQSGTLTLESPGKSARVHFQGGAVVFGESDQEKLRLSAILLRKKRIGRQEFERIDELMRTEGGRFGQFAIQQGVLTDEQLRDFLKVQVSEVIYDAFVWTEGTFRFQSSAALPEHAVTITIDLPNLIMEGARRIQEWEQCVKLLPDERAIFRVVVTPKDDRITLTADEWKILFLINGQRTLEELVADSDEEAISVYRVVYGLKANNLIEPVRPADRANDTSALEGDRSAPNAPEETLRQTAPLVYDEATVREAMNDDTSLLVSSEAHLSYSDVAKPVIGQLIVKNGSQDGQIFPLTEGEYLVGRQKDNSIQLNDLGVSGFHARIFRSVDGYTIEDLKSRNGTWLNGNRVFHAVLRDGDELRIGATDLCYEVLYQPPVSPA